MLQLLHCRSYSIAFILLCCCNKKMKAIANQWYFYALNQKGHTAFFAIKIPLKRTHDFFLRKNTTLKGSMIE